MKFKLSQKVLVVAALPVLVQLGYLAFMTNSLNQLAARQTVEQVKTGILVLRDRLYMDLAESTVQYSIYRATLDQLYKLKTIQSVNDIARTIHTLSTLLAGEQRDLLLKVWNEYESSVWMQLRSDSGPRQEKLANLGREIVGMGADEATVLKYFSRIMNRQLDYFEHAFEAVFLEEQKRQLAAEKDIDVLLKELHRSLLLGLIVISLVSLGSALFFVVEISSRLKRILINIKSMEDGTFELRPAGGKDEIGQLDVTIRRTATEMREAEQFQAHTVALVAEELERPLASLSTAFTSLKQTGFQQLSEKGSMRLDGTNLEVGRLRRLVSEFALINTEKTAQLDLSVREIDLANTAISAAEIVGELAGSKKIQLRCEPVSVKVFADENRTLQVVVNLLSNALKFSPPNTVVSITTSVQDKFGVLSVSDQGPGISDEFKTKIFSNFEQANASDATEKKGTGLGLAISKNIIEQQHGKMGFDTVYGSGTTFWLSLPKDNLIVNSGVAGDTTKPRQWQSTFWKKGLVLIALPLLVNLLTLGMFSLVFRAMSENIVGFRHARSIASLHAQVVEDLARGLSYAFLFNVAQEKSNYKRALSRRQDVKDSLSQVDALALDNFESSAQHNLRKLLDQNFEWQNDILRAPQNADTDRWFGKKTGLVTQRLIADTEKPIQQVIQHEQEQMDSRSNALSDTRNLLNYGLLSCAILSALVSSAIALVMARRLSKRINVVAENAIRLAHRVPPQHTLQGNDELAFVDKALVDAANKLMELERARQEMVAVSSHELRTPLTSLSALCELISTGTYGPLTADGERIVDVSIETIADIVSMITNLLDLEKMQSGKVLVHKESSALLDVLQKAASNVIPFASKHNVELKVEHEKLNNDSNEIAELDNFRLVQALTSLVKEFVEDLPAQSVVSLSSQRHQHNVTIKITAPNLRSSDATLAVGKHAARQRLAIELTRQIAEQHGGQMQIRTSQDTRAVTISLPVVA